MSNGSRPDDMPRAESAAPVETTMGKPLRWSIPVLLASLAAGCGKKPGVRNGDWEYDRSGVLSFRSKSVPAELAANHVNLVTPLGTFQPGPDGRWIRVTHEIPLPDPNRSWVPITLRSPAFTGSMDRRGYYRVDELPVDPETWRDVQLEGTPPSWIYAFKVTNGRETGYWMSPLMLGEIDWSKL